MWLLVLVLGEYTPNDDNQERERWEGLAKLFGWSLSFPSTGTAMTSSECEECRYRLCVEAANRGLAVAHYWLTTFRSKPHSNEFLLHHLSLAAASGHDRAQCALANLYLLWTRSKYNKKKDCVHLANDDHRATVKRVCRQVMQQQGTHTLPCVVTLQGHMWMGAFVGLGTGMVDEQAAFKAYSTVYSVSKKKSSCANATRKRLGGHICVSCC